jgi:N-acetyl-anhydromuramyl-L-alanine amidase AmpD
MSYALTWLPDVLKGAGLKVALQPGWEDRGHREMGDVFGVICHHTAGPKAGNMPSLGVVTNGRPDLSGPLAQLCLGRDGTYYVVAAGLCYHAGAGNWRNVTTGNTNFIGIEAENTGLANDRPWPDIQMDAYRRGVAAILQHISRGVEWCAGHKEYALPAGRKDDPDFDMDAFRTGVAAILSGNAPAPVLIPRSDAAGNPTLRRGNTGPDVARLQTALRIDPADGNFGPNTEAIVRAFQLQKQLTPDGIVGPKTWAAISG